ncbi:hypothetical protein LPLAFNJD_LOCUS1849 [Methylorubrum aminovorans]
MAAQAIEAVAEDEEQPDRAGGVRAARPQPQESRDLLVVEPRRLGGETVERVRPGLVRSRHDPLPHPAAACLGFDKRHYHSPESMRNT